MAAITDYIRQALSMANPLSQQRLADMERMQAQQGMTGKPSFAVQAQMGSQNPSIAYQGALRADQDMGLNQQALVRHLKRSGEQAAGLFEEFGAPEIAKQVRNDPSGMAQFFSENGGAMPLLSVLAKGKSGGVSVAGILRHFPNGITDPTEERIVREALLAAGMDAADVENVVEGHRAGGPAPTMIQSGDQNVGLSPYGGTVSEIGGVPIGGRRSSPTVQINTPVNIAGNALEARRQFYQEVKPLQMGLDKIAQARSSLALARTGNAQAVRTLITNVEQAIQPTSAVLESEFARTREFGDLPTRFENWVGQQVSGTMSQRTLDEIEAVLDSLDAVTREGIEARRAGFAPFEESFGAQPGMATGGLGGPSVPRPAAPRTPAAAPQGDVQTLPSGATVEWLEE
jgi:hypothetical protein